MARTSVYLVVPLLLIALGCNGQSETPAAEKAAGPGGEEKSPAAEKAAGPGGEENSPASPPPCDPEALMTVARGTFDKLKEDAYKAVWPGVKAACGDSLSANHAMFFTDLPPNTRVPAPPSKDQKWIRSVRLVCPDVDEVAKELAKTPARLRATAAYTLCDFGRFDVYTVDRFSGRSSPAWASWSILGLMLESGTDREAAKRLTRGLLELEFARQDAEKKFDASSFHGMSGPKKTK